MLWILGIATAVGVVVLVIGLRGRRINDRPYCRSCDFDLHGLPKGSETCPECAADLGFRGAIRKGRRRRRPWLVTVGILVLAAAIGLDTLWLWGRLTRQDLTPMKPDWWLVAEARSGGPEAAAALDELVVRLGNRELSAANAAFLVDRALTEQIDPDGEWFGRWGAIFEAAWQADLVSEGQLETFARQVLPLEFRHRDVIRVGETWTAAEAVSAIRLSPSMPLARWKTLERVEVGGKVVFNRAVDPARAPAPASLGGPQAQTDWVMLEHDLPAPDVEVGRHPVRAVYFLQVFDPRTTPPTLILQDRVEVHSEIEVAPAGTAVVTLVTDADLEDRVRAAIEPRSARIYIERNMMHTWSAVDVREPPVGVAFDVQLRVGDRTWPVGSFAVPGGHRDIANYGGREFPLTGLETEGLVHVELILTPSAVAAESKAWSGDEFWGGEIVLENVTVEIIDRR
jgi:hypothetical protein